MRCRTLTTRLNAVGAINQSGDRHGGLRLRHYRHVDDTDGTLKACVVGGTKIAKTALTAPNIVWDTFNILTTPGLHAAGWGYGDTRGAGT